MSVGAAIGRRPGLSSRAKNWLKVRQPLGMFGPAVDQRLLDRVFRCVAQEGLQNVVVEGFTAVQEITPLPGEFGQPVTKDAGALRDCDLADVNLLVDQPEEVGQPIADLFGVALVRRRGLPRRRIGLARDPSDEAGQVVVVLRQGPAASPTLGRARDSMIAQRACRPAAGISPPARPGPAPDRAWCADRARSCPVAAWDAVLSRVIGRHHTAPRSAFPGTAVPNGESPVNQLDGGAIRSVTASGRPWSSSGRRSSEGAFRSWNWSGRRCRG